MVSLMQIKQELVVALRNESLISISDRGVTTETDTGTFSATSSYTLSTSPTLVKNVRSVVVSASPLSFGTDYTVNYTTGVISFTSAQTGDYTIIYDYGSKDRIFPDFPQPHLKLSDFPRIAVDIINSSSNEIGIGADITESDYTVSIICYATEQTVVEDLVSGVKDFLMANKKNLFYSPFITPTITGPLLVTEFGNNKLLQRNIDADVRFEFNGI
ncbi:MAG: hypothetical protein ACTSQA_00225 [Candidatus Heimdallarchaeaceae archaeon]